VGTAKTVIHRSCQKFLRNESQSVSEMAHSYLIIDHRLSIESAFYQLKKNVIVLSIPIINIKMHKLYI